MFNKFISIHHVGKFLSYSSQGDVAFCRLTLIYAGNGQGKTTMCDIFRSLNAGDGRYIAGRETLGANGTAAIKLRINDQNRSFANGNWDQPANSFLIYDATFINDNVYSGEHVTHNHKKNLYHVIIGEQGVSLARSVSELDAKLREATRQLSAKNDALARIAPAGTPTSAFMKLAAEDDLDNKIRRKTEELAALEDVSRILAKPFLRELALPQFPADYADLLSTTFEGVSGDIEARVKAHVLTHTAGRGESWLSQGLEFSRSDSCPFCGQSLEGVSLFAAYKAYFSDAYSTHTARLRNMAGRINGPSFGQSPLLNCQGILLENASVCQGWPPFLSLQPPELDFPTVSAAMDRIRTVSLTLLDEKQKAPLEPLAPDDQFNAALEQYEGVRQLVSTYNTKVADLNQKILAKKNEAQTGDLVTVQGQLARLRAIKRRYEPDAIDACNAVVEAEQQKKNVEREKDKIKAQLEAYTSTVFGKYQERINQLLTMFSAGFQIGDTKGRYVGGSPSSHYSLIINNVPIDLGDPDCPPDTACFKNTLSAGDKSTLALSFFIARAEKDNSLSDKIVVFDDPFTSQDRSRRTCTQQLITSLCGKAKQIILLSHDPAFLQLVHEASHGCEVKTLQLGAWGLAGTKLTNWDIIEATKNGYIQFFTVILTFVTQRTGARREVAQSIRLLLEQYMRLKLPSSFTATEWLGDFIGKIRECTDPATPLYNAKDILDELSYINDFSKKYHHSTPGADLADIDDDELHAYAARTIKLVQSF
jgi:wobble nucleotide-excising tRNase